MHEAIEREAGVGEQRDGRQDHGRGDHVEKEVGGRGERRVGVEDEAKDGRDEQRVNGRRRGGPGVRRELRERRARAEEARRKAWVMPEAGQERLDHEGIHRRIAQKQQEEPMKVAQSRCRQRIRAQGGRIGPAEQSAERGDARLILRQPTKEGEIARQNGQRA